MPSGGTALCTNICDTQMGHKSGFYTFEVQTILFKMQPFKLFHFFTSNIFFPMLYAFFFSLKNYWTKHQIFLTVLNKVTCDSFGVVITNFQQKTPFFQQSRSFRNTVRLDLST